MLIQTISNLWSANIMWWILFTYAVLLVSENYAKQVTISIYYETLCPDSINFFNNQLHPTYNVLKDKMNLDLIPFGKATITKKNGKWNFACQHGNAECYGNKIHACALDLAPGMRSTEFAICAMKSGDSSNEENLKQCASDNNIGWEDIQKCMESGKADELLVINGNRTNAVEPKITFIPTIIFNNVYKASYQKMALHNLMEIVESLVGTKEC